MPSNLLWLAVNPNGSWINTVPDLRSQLRVQDQLEIGTAVTARYSLAITVTVTVSAVPYKPMSKLLLAIRSTVMWTGWKQQWRMLFKLRTKESCMFRIKSIFVIPMYHSVQICLLGYLTTALNQKIDEAQQLKVKLLRLVSHFCAL